MDFEKEIKSRLNKELGLEISLEVPPRLEMGDFAFACFSLAKKLKKNPQEVANDLSEKLKFDNIKVKAQGPYLNFFIDKNIFNKQILENILSKKYLNDRIKGSKIVIDFSAPNVAKHMGIHNLRSTVIGQALVNLYEFKGYEVIGVNHLGDWGTNFGQLILGIKKFSSLDKIKHVRDLNEVYVKFHELAENNDELKQQARDEFTKLENGDEEAKKYWKKFIEVSLSDYNKIYDRLNVKFSYTKGESEYIPLINETLKEIKFLTKLDDGALVVDVGEEMPPCLLKKKDGSTLYGLRDITAGLYRLKEYNPEKILYVTDIAQSLHFKQWFKVMELLDKKNKERFIHVIFGRLSFKDGVMSTRKGKVVILEEVLDKSKEKALEIIKQKNPDLKNKEEVAEQIGVGSIIFNDLFNDRVHNIIFDWDKVLDFEGDTGPYVQYVYARCNSVLNKFGKEIKEKRYSLLKEKSELELIKILSNFNYVIKNCIKDNKPSHLAKYLVGLSRSFNTFYGNCPIITENNYLTEARVLLVYCVKEIIGKGLDLLNIKHPEEM